MRQDEPVTRHDVPLDWQSPSRSRRPRRATDWGGRAWRRHAAEVTAAEPPPPQYPSPAHPFCPAAGGTGLRYEGVSGTFRPPPERSQWCRPAARTGGAGAGPGLAAHPPGAGAGRAGRRRGVRPRPGAADGPAARRPGPPATPGRDGGGGRRADRRRRRGAAGRRVAGQRPGRPPDPPRPGAPPARRRRDGALPRARLRAVVEYIEGHLDASPSLEQMPRSPASAPTTSRGSSRRRPVCRRTSTSSIRRVEQARQLLEETDLTLAEVAARAGFSDQSQFSHHFKRLVGVTPGQFRTPARIT